MKFALENLKPDSLRKQLSSLARSIRKSEFMMDANFTVPQLDEEDTFFFDNIFFKRKRILLLSRGCSVAACTMCPLPNEAIYDRSGRPTEEDLIRQFEAAFAKTSIDEFGIINIYNNGNFFADREIPSKVRQHIYRRVGKSKAAALMVESLPQFIVSEKMEEAKRYLGEKRLIVCIGLESADDLVRELCVNSTCTKFLFEQAVSLLRKHDYLPRVFLMIKPPFLTEKEAVEDAVKSVHYLSGLGILDPTLCPTRVSPQTIVNMLLAMGRYYPPWLWSVVEILRRIRQHSSPRIAVSNLKPERNLKSICAKNCDACSDSLINKIEQFNIERDFGLLESFRCRCYQDYKKFLFKEEQELGQLPLQERIRQFLEELR